MTFLSHWFTTIIYQPFFNLLVFFYWMLDLITGGNADMGIAVILLTLVIRFLLLPLALAGDKSEAERREIAARIKEAEEEYADEPVLRKKATKHIMRSSRPVLIGEIFNLFIQVVIALMLWRMFNTGLTGEDIHLIYPFMPEVTQPFNLVFLGDFDLTHPSWRLNMIQSLLLFILETISVYISIYKVSKEDVVRLQLVLPVVSFLIFLALPAGKQLFVITSLAFSIVLTFFKAIQRRYEDYKAKVAAAEAAQDEEKIVVETK
jgi:membrane protein insertase Oxa1/YidC/SpoIIIJ